MSREQREQRPGDGRQQYHPVDEFREYEPELIRWTRALPPDKREPNAHPARPGTRLPTPG